MIVESFSLARRQAHSQWLVATLSGCSLSRRYTTLCAMLSTLGSSTPALGKQLSQLFRCSRGRCCMFANVGALHSELLEKDPRDFVSHYLFEPVPFAFAGDLVAWIKWKTELARGLGIDPYDVVLTGSAALGYSLNPKKGYKPFDSSSDIDCGVISQYHFEVAWRYLRHLRPAWLSLPPESKRALVAHQKTYVFAGTIATDSILA